MKQEVGFITTHHVTFDVCDVAGNEVKTELTLWWVHIIYCQFSRYTTLSLRPWSVCVCVSVHGFLHHSCYFKGLNVVGSFNSLRENMLTVNFTSSHICILGQLLSIRAEVIYFYVAWLKQQFKFSMKSCRFFLFALAEGVRWTVINWSVINSKVSCKGLSCPCCCFGRKENTCVVL